MLIVVNKFAVSLVLCCLPQHCMSLHLNISSSLLVIYLDIEYLKQPLVDTCINPLHGYMFDPERDPV